MIRVGDLTLYSILRAGMVASFTADHARTVKLTVNAPQEARLSVVPMHPDGTFPDTEPLFLATVTGLQEVEFYARGAFGLVADDVDIYVRTFDGTEIHAVVPDAVTFTKITERRARNPEIEALQQMLLKNQERRMGAIFEDFRLERERNNRTREALAAEREALDSAKSAASGDEQAPKEQPVPPSDKSKPPKAGVGNEGGKSDA